MSVYYNEFDPFAAAWLRELIKAELAAKLPKEIEYGSLENHDFFAAILAEMKDDMVELSI
jgi:hypothetical protein